MRKIYFYCILDEYQGQGYATEAVKLALKWAFGHPEVVAVEAESGPDNAASQRVMEKCGFLATGEIGEEGPRFIVYKGANRSVNGAGCPGVARDPGDLGSATTEVERRPSVQRGPKRSVDVLRRPEWNGETISNE